MFVSTLNQKALAWLKSQRRSFAGREVVVGFSGSFATELMLIRLGVDGGGPKAIHGHDVSLFSYAFGEYLSGVDHIDARPRDDAPDWLKRAWGPGARGVAVLHVMLDMLAYVKQNNPHAVRMWAGYVDQFSMLVDRTEESALTMPRQLDTFSLGSVSDHFAAHDDPGAVFIFQAPATVAMYDRLLNAMDPFFEWTPPAHKLLALPARDLIREWCRDGRQYVWYDDRKFDGEEPVLLQERPNAKPVYLYSNLIGRTGYFGPYDKPRSLPLPLASATTVLTPDMKVEFLPIKCSDLADYKDQFLAKKIDHSMGTWAYAVAVGDSVVGFMEFARSKYGLNEIYINSDFPSPYSRYTRLSKLIVMLLLSTDIRDMMERKLMQRCYNVSSTAFTEKPVSMKYRGVLHIVKRGAKPDGSKYLNYEGKFGTQNAQEVYAEWLKRHGSQMHSPTSITPSME